jgi:PhzF family phenazine biosynthesis protein
MKVYTVNAFSKGQSGGNKAGVCVLERSISKLEKLSVAKAVGYSETAFIDIIDHQTVYIDYFTPTEEVDLCGHATIASFYYLRHLNLISDGLYLLKTSLYELSIQVKGSFVVMEQPPAKFGNKIPSKELAFSLGVLAEEFDQNDYAQIVSTGIEDIIIGVKGTDQLRSIIPDDNEIIHVCQTSGAYGYHVFCPAEERGHYYVRNFAPLLGIKEESATGTANCALSAYLRDRGNTLMEFTFYQGMWMGEDSIIKTLYNETTKSFWVGGSGYLKSEEPVYIF